MSTYLSENPHQSCTGTFKIHQLHKTQTMAKSQTSNNIFVNTHNVHNEEREREIEREIPVSHGGGTGVDVYTHPVAASRIPGPTDCCQPLMIVIKKYSLAISYTYKYKYRCKYRYTQKYTYQYAYRYTHS